MVAGAEFAIAILVVRTGRGESVGVAGHRRDQVRYHSATNSATPRAHRIYGAGDCSPQATGNRQELGGVQR